MEKIQFYTMALCLRYMQTGMQRKLTLMVLIQILPLILLSSFLFLEQLRILMEGLKIQVEQKYRRIIYHRCLESALSNTCIHDLRAKPLFFSMEQRKSKITILMAKTTNSMPHPMECRPGLLLTGVIVFVLRRRPRFNFQLKIFLTGTTGILLQGFQPRAETM